MKYGLSVHSRSNIHLLGPNNFEYNKTLICTSEISDPKNDKTGLQDLVEDHLEYLLGVGKLCVFKEFHCGHGGAVDFLAINNEGKVFLIEVKRARDQRAKFDVVFQVLKYHCFPAEILQRLQEPFLKSKFEEVFNLKPEEAALLAQRARLNIENRLMNPIIIVDEASYPLIAHAYSLALREIDGELRVIEINKQRIRTPNQTEEYDMLYVRRFFSNDAWIGNACLNNRQPTEYVPLEKKLQDIPDEQIRQVIRRLLNETGIQVARAAKSEKTFTLISRKAYFSFDPEGKIAQGMYPHIAKSKNPYRIILVDAKPDIAKRLIEIGFKLEVSRNRKRSYYVFDLTPSMTDEKLMHLIGVLGTIKIEPKAR